MAKQKFYVVWQGREPGIYTSWEACRLQTEGFNHPRFKAFATEEEAEAAFAAGPSAHEKKETTGETSDTPEATTISQREITECLVVDAACSGNPGPMEYRGVHLPSGKQVFHFGPIYGTNNIGEFLAIVRALAFLKQHSRSMPVYSDSQNALAWIKARKCRTKLERNERTEEAFRLIDRAERWLRTHDYNDLPLLKWATKEWGEVPADFGRK